MGRFLFSAWLALALATASVIFFFSAYLLGDLRGWRTFSWVVLCLFLFWFSYQNLKAGQLRCWLSWNGHDWQILTLGSVPESDPTLQARYAMTVHLDMQQWVFVSLQGNNGARQWFWLGKETFPDRWHGFRCAVYSRSEVLSS